METQYNHTRSADNVPAPTDTYEDSAKAYEFGDEQPSLFDSPTEEGTDE